jgi:hypothetical protein
MIRKLIVTVSFVGLAAGSAFAQQPAPKPAAAPAEAPVRTVSTEVSRIVEDSKRDELSRKLLQRKQELNVERHENQMVHARERKEFAQPSRPASPPREKK